MVQEYVDKVSQYMPECVSDLGTACMLLNNLQALRSNVELLYRDMGGDTVGPWGRVSVSLKDASWFVA